MMKRTIAVVALVCAATVLAWPRALFSLTSTGTSVNQSTGGVQNLEVWCDAAACVTVGKGAGTTATCAQGQSNTGFPVPAGQTPYPIPMTSGGLYPVDTVAIVAVSGTAHCQFAEEVLPQ